jgi:glycosyltransferase involved in cell wall biosynthesis
VVIVDSGLRGPGGHNLSYTRAVRRALLEKGLGVEVLVNRGCPAALAEASGFRRVFTSGAYDHPLAQGRVRDLVYLHAQSLAFGEELDHAFRRLLPRPPDLAFSHTLADFEVVGWRRHLRRAPFAGSLALLMRHTPRYSTASWLSRQLNPYWRLRPRAFAAMHRRLRERFRLCTDSDLLTRDYARVYGGPILTLPIPLTSEVRATRRQTTSEILQRLRLSQGRRPLIGYLGDARTPKGFPLIPAALEEVRRAGLPAHFIVQCPLPQGGADDATAAALSNLQAMPEDVTLVPEHLSDADYADLLEALDVVLVPYLHPVYLEATSGVFTEALARGKPVVVPSGTWMAHELAGSAAGVEFDRDRPEELPRALVRLLGALELHAAEAGKRGEDWRAFHTPEALVNRLLTATLGPEPAREAIA